jgi:hypothetical protein
MQVAALPGTPVATGHPTPPDTRLGRRQRAFVAGALVLLWLGVASALAITLGWKVRNWSVMTDEMLYAKLATSVADTGSPLPRIHESSAGVYNMLYPLLLAPLYGLLSPPDAFRAAHVLNAFAMASAAFPAYLLAREVIPRGWSFLVAALSITLPWMVLTGFLLTESIAYPAFLWAVLALQQAISRPSRRADLLAVAALGLAVLARTQFVVLLLVLPLSIAGHEVARALVARNSMPRRRKLLEGAAEAIRRHRPLALAYALGGAAALVLAAIGSVSGVLGSYAIALEEGSILPADTWGAAARHLDAVAIGMGLIPFILGGGWIIATAVRSRSEREHSLATLSLVTVVLLTIEVASFSARFEGVDPSHELRDRYAFYVSPLFLVGTVAALTTAPRRRVAVGSAVAAVLFAAPALQLPFETAISADAPANVVNHYLVVLSGDLATGAFVALVSLVIGVLLVLGMLLVPRALAAPVVGVMLAFSFLSLSDAVDRVRSSQSLPGRPVAEPPGPTPDWVDSALPADATAAVVAFPVSRSWWTSAIRWWDVEFWNRSVGRAFISTDGNFTYTPWRRETLAVDWTTGEFPGTSAAPPYAVVAPDDARFLLAGERLAANDGLAVWRIERPYRAVWATRGLDPDGWARNRRPATIRVFPHVGRGPHLVRVQLSLQASDRGPAHYRISAPGEATVGRLARSERRRVAMQVCVPTRSPTDVTVHARGNALIEGVPLSPTSGGARRVGAQVGAISIAHTGHACRR